MGFILGIQTFISRRWKGAFEVTVNKISYVDGGPEEASLAVTFNPMSRSFFGWMNMAFLVRAIERRIDPNTKLTITLNMSEAEE